jgi:hypothetical protein
MGLGSRKTLVGIVPPAKPAARAASSAPAAKATPPVAEAQKTASMVIAGAPCKSIDVSSEDDAELPPSIAALRRPGSPTVPFPRPRASARAMPWELDPMSGDVPGRDTIPSSWRERTGHTLRVVLTDRDHRPHLIAGLVVCAAAAVVIFAAGRSPVAGTGVLGQATRSLEPPVQNVPATPATPSMAEPQRRASPEAAAPPSSANAPEAASEAPQSPRLQGEELAPGLVIPPPPPKPAEAAVRPHTDLKPKPGLSPSTPAAPASPAFHPAASGASHAAAPVPAAREAGAGAESATSIPPMSTPPMSALPVAPRAAPKKPGTEPGAPPRPANGDFDFGI